MQKPQSLRAHLVAANPKLKNDPDKLHLFVDTGNALGTATEGHSFAYRYTVTILIMDYEGEVDALMVPLLAWVKVYQPELVANPDKRQTGVKFEVDFNNNKTADISIEMELTESRIVTKDENGVLNIRAGKEVQPTPDYSDQEFWTLQAEDGTLLAEWYTPS